jgi:hypothetical protein
MKFLWLAIAIIVIARIGWRFYGRGKSASNKPAKPLKPLTPLQKKLYTVWVFFSVNIRRLFRDRLALFFTFLFPLIFLFVFGSLNSGNNSVSLSVAIINESHTSFARQFASQLEHQKLLKVNKSITTFAAANQKMSRGEMDATIELPASFGTIRPGENYRTLH